MAAITLPSKGRGYQLVLDLSLNSQSVANNQSVVNWSLYILKGSGSGAYTSYTCYWSGPGASGSRPGFDFRGYTSLGLGSGTFVVNHNPDGTGTANASGAFSETDSDPELGNGTVYASLGLPTIPRATQPTVSPTSGDTGSTYTITHAPATSTFYHDVAYSLDGGTTYTDIQTDIVGTDTSTDWTPAHSLLPNATSITAVIRVITRQSSGGTVIGTRTVNLPLTVPATIKPTVSSVGWADAQTSSPDIPTLMGGAGRFVQGWSKLLPTVTSAGAGGSTIVSASVTQSGQVTASGTAFTAPVNLSGAVPFSATARDSRGVTSDAYTNTVAVTAYNFPSLPTPEVTRTADAAGLIPSPVGTYFAITPLASVSSLIFGGSQKNLLEWRIRVKQVGGSYITVQDWNSATVSGNTWTTKQVIGGSYLASNEYVVEVSIRDLFGKNGFNAGSTVKSLEILVPSERVEMDMDGAEGIGIGGYRRDPFRLDVHGDIGQDGNRVVDVTDLATTTAKGIVELATSAETSGLSATDLAVTPAGLAALVARLLDASRGRNLIINGNFRTNQRGYVSGVALTPGRRVGYAHDRWCDASRVQQVRNPRASTNTADWDRLGSGSGAVTRQTSGGPLVSAPTYVRTPATAAGTNLGSWISEAGIPVVAGQIYRVSAWMRCSSAVTAKLEAIRYSGGTSLGFSTTYTQPIPANTWVRLALTVTVEPGANGIRLHMQTTNTLSSGQWFDVSACLVVEGTDDPAYFDGGTGRWLGTAGASQSADLTVATSYSFTAAPQGQSVTIVAGGAIQQRIEQTNALAGDYVLSWAGGATGRVYSEGDAPPAFSASPVAVSLTGAADVVVEFAAVGGARTVGAIQLEVGSKPTPYRHPSVAEELLACQRYFYAIPTAEGRAQNTYFNVALGYGEIVGEKHPVIMRRVPDVTVVAGSSIYPNALPFDFFAANASGLISKILAGGWSTTTRIKFNYDSGNNGGATLPGGYLTGVNTVPIWVNAEM